VPEGKASSEGQDSRYVCLRYGGVLFHHRTPYSSQLAMLPPYRGVVSGLDALLEGQLWGQRCKTASFTLNRLGSHQAALLAIKSMGRCLEG